MTLTYCHNDSNDLEPSVHLRTCENTHTHTHTQPFQTLTSCIYCMYNWASVASPILGCSIEISRDIYISESAVALSI